MEEKTLNRILQLQERYYQLERLVSLPEVISDKEKFSEYSKELGKILPFLNKFRELEKIKKEILDLKKILEENKDRDLILLAEKEIEDLNFEEKKKEKEVEKLFSKEEKFEDRNVIVEIRQGTGGLEASLFAADLYRMYTKYAIKKGWKIESISTHPTELGGFKEIIFSAKGKDVYKILIFESGVHRVQRIPTTEAGGRIHTSTATVAILVEPEEIELKIDPKDLKIESFRASGPGGQHLQKTDSAIRITYLPTGEVVSCQDERSQVKNKEKALRVLRARLLEKKRTEEEEKISKERKEQIGKAKRAEKIRTYNFPDRRVTDHRIGLTVHRLSEILEGELDYILTPLLESEIES